MRINEDSGTVTCIYIKLLCLFLLHFGFIHNQGTVCNINQVLQIFN